MRVSSRLSEARSGRARCARGALTSRCEAALMRRPSESATCCFPGRVGADLDGGSVHGGTVPSRDVAWERVAFMRQGSAKRSQASEPRRWCGRLCRWIAWWRHLLVLQGVDCMATRHAQRSKSLSARRHRSGHTRSLCSGWVVNFAVRVGGGQLRQSCLPVCPAG